MPVLDPVRRLLLHLGEYVPDNFGVLVRGPLRARGIDGHIAELRPRERMVQVVLQEVVFREILEVCVLYEGQVGGPK